MATTDTNPNSGAFVPLEQVYALVEKFNNQRKKDDCKIRKLEQRIQELSEKVASQNIQIEDQTQQKLNYQKKLKVGTVAIQKLEGQLHEKAGKIEALAFQLGLKTNFIQDLQNTTNNTIRDLNQRLESSPSELLLKKIALLEQQLDQTTQELELVTSERDRLLKTYEGKLARTETSAKRSSAIPRVIQDKAPTSTTAMEVSTAVSSPSRQYSLSDNPHLTRAKMDSPETHIRSLFGGPPPSAAMDTSETSDHFISSLLRPDSDLSDSHRHPRSGCSSSTATSASHSSTNGIHTYFKDPS